MRLRFCATINPSKSEIGYFPDNMEVSFLPMEAIGDDGTVSLDATRTISSVQQGYTYFRDGDVLIAKITPCFENGKGACVSGLLNGVGFGTTELIVVRAVPDRLNNAFLHWAFTSPDFRNAATATMFGAGGQKRVPDDFVRDYRLALPQLPMQQAIAAFLDRETAKIDALVAEQERLLVLLEEKRQAVIANAVTKGLDPTVPMKDSGVEWLGQVPAHWSLQPVRWLSTFVTSGPRGWSDHIDIEGSLFIQSGDLTEDATIEFSGAKRVKVKDDAETARTSLQDGDVVVCITGAKTGKVAVCTSLPETAYVNQHLCLIRPQQDVISAFLGQSLKSRVGREHFQSTQYGLKQGLGSVLIS